MTCQVRCLGQRGKGVIMWAMSEPFTVIKNDHAGREVWRYQGVILERSATRVTIEANFDRELMELDYITLRRGDRFVEYHYGDRWYSIYKIYDVEGGQLKGWYCNFSRPAQIDTTELRADDLALDLFVYPDGRTLVLDQDEFDALPIGRDERAAVLDALEELQKLARAGRMPPAR